MVHLFDVHHVDHTQGDVHPCRQVLVLFCVKDERSNCLAVVLLHHNGLAVILIRLIPGFIIFDPFLTGIYKQQRQLKFPFSIHFSRLKRFDRPTIPTKLLDKLVNQWIINKLYINNKLSIPDVFNRLSIDVQWNINYYWTILVTDSKGKLLPRLSKHHQWTNLQLGVWSQRCSMLMHCPSMQVKSPSLFFLSVIII